ncbi:MAG: GNAT family N-acetyltransferase [Candidatus Competibacteraceae bacterium]|nr:GNAT family N-acetyltransferase [Candidatus Competibacteraceae bacterium]MCB1810282.1 GNAT family N-acetyltransferase [Candidatus Competibacteraceae bacterium]
MDIQPGDLTHPQVLALLREHLDSMGLYSPPESIHALAPDDLLRPDVTFWCVWNKSDLLGCGALKEIDDTHGEIKSMRTSSKHLRQGVASHMLRHLIAEANNRGYHRLSLETGTAEAFLPAQKLYASFGFSVCEPFGDYVEDPFSTFMTKALIC